MSKTIITTDDVDDENNNKFLKIKSMESDLSKYLNEIIKKQCENQELISKIKFNKKNRKTNDNNEQQSFMHDNLQKQINELSKRCDYTENALLCLSDMFKNFSDLISNLNDCLKQNQTKNYKEEEEVIKRQELEQQQQPQLEEQEQEEAINYSQPRDSKSKINTRKILQTTTYDDNDNNNYANDDDNNNDDDDDDDDGEDNEQNKNDLNYLDNINDLERPYDISTINIQDVNFCTTQELANLLKENLIKYKISQQIFAETILNMKQANLSALLSQPNTWETLTQINRNRFLIILMWLNDPKRLERINFYKSKQNINNKSTKNSKKIKSLTCNQNTTNTKRQRIVLSKYQQDKLKQSYNSNAYPNSDEIDLLAAELDLNPKKSQHGSHINVKLIKLLKLTLFDKKKHKPLDNISYLTNNFRKKKHAEIN